MRSREHRSLFSSPLSTSTGLAPILLCGLLCCLLAGAMAGCSDDGGGSPDATPPLEANLENVQNLFNRSCGGGTCHINFMNQPGGALDLRPGASCANLVAVNAVEVPARTLLVPNNPGQSYLLCKSTPNCADLPDRAVLMPPPGGLGAVDLDLLSRWIGAGAPGCTTGDDVTPPVFAGAKAATGQTQAIGLEWDTATDDVTQSEDIVYLVYQATQAGAQDFAQPPLLETPAGASSVVVSGLAVSTQYYYVVRARDAAGNIDFHTEEISATTLAVEDSTPPTFAGAATATALGATVIELTWAAATDELSPAAEIVYNVYVAETSAGQQFATPTLTTLGGATSALLTRLRPGVTYFAVVRAVDRALNEDQNMVEVQATTEDDIFFPQDIQPILTQRCALSGCHTSVAPAEGLDLSEGKAYAELFEVDASQCVGGDTRLRVEPENPDGSYLVDKVRNRNICGVDTLRMPKDDNPLLEDEIALIEQWITQGAPEN